MRLQAIASAALLLPGLAIAQVTISGSALRVTTDPGSQFDPAISGTVVVYTDLRNINADVYFTDLTTGVETRVTSGTADEQLNDISGSTIVYTQFGTGTGGGDVLSYAIGGSPGTVAADPVSAQKNPGISGSVVAWEDTRDGNHEIYARNLAGGSAVRLTNSPQTDMDPAVSGARVAYVRRDSTAGTCHIFVTDVVTLATRQVTSGAGCHGSPDISGHRVVYHGNRDGNQDVFVYDLAANSETRIGLTGVQRNANVSGDFVAFEDVASANSDIRLYHVPTATLTTAVGTASNEFLNDIDGNRVAYTSDAAGHLDIWVYEFTSTTQGGDTDDGRGKVTLCHVPPGNPNAAHTISVGAPAVAAHLAHGDTVGPCAGGGSAAIRLGSYTDIGVGVLSPTGSNLTVQTEVRYPVAAPDERGTDPFAAGSTDRGEGSLDRSSPGYGCSSAGRASGGWLALALLALVPFLPGWQAARARIRRR